MNQIKGITWGHIRAIDPLRASADIYERDFCDTNIQWDIRSLSSFEHQPIEELVEQYDMIVFDHPYCGKLDKQDLFTELNLDSLQPKNTQNYIGNSLLSYQYNEKIWGAPVDGATNHAIYRQDLLAQTNEKLPVSWDEAIELGKRLKKQGKSIAMAANGHHGLLVVAALCANLGAPWSTDASKPFEISEDILTEAIEAMKTLLEFCSEESCDWNSIDLHNAMTTRDDLVYCPCVYGFSVYGEEGIYQNKLSFADFAGLQAPYYKGSVLGGAAVSLTAKSKNKEAVLKYIDWLTSQDVQHNIFANYHGQPARIEAWEDEEMDKQFNHFFSATQKSMETAYTRPRFYGYQTFESKAGNVLEECLRHNSTVKDTVAKIIELSKTEFISW